MISSNAAVVPVGLRPEDDERVRLLTRWTRTTALLEEAVIAGNMPLMETCLQRRQEMMEDLHSCGLPPVSGIPCASPDHEEAESNSLALRLAVCIDGFVRQEQRAMQAMLARREEIEARLHRLRQRRVTAVAYGVGMTGRRQANFEIRG